MATLTIESNGEVIHSMVMIAILIEQYGHIPEDQSSKKHLS